MPLRRAIKLDPDEVAALRVLYLTRGIPDGQYARRPEELSDFTEEWNAKQKREDTSEELLHYIATQRKQGKWVTFDGNHEKLAATPDEFLDKAGWKALVGIYVDLGVFSDNYTYDVELKKDCNRSRQSAQ